MRIAFLGDMAFFGNYSVENNPRVFDYFAEAAELLRGYDLVVGNLETPLVAKGRPSGAKSAYIKADPGNVELLKFLKVGVVTLANNHIFDYGATGFAQTKRVLEENGIQHFGTDGRQLLLNFAGGRVALHGYCCYSTNPLGIDRGKGGVNPLAVPIVEENLQKNAAAGYFNIVSVHSGEEHVNYPNYDAVLMARRFASVAPYLFYGHHPHVMQGVEALDGSLICYSLGNFCFDDVYTPLAETPLVKQSENNRTGFILEIEVAENRLTGHRVIPIYAAADRLRIDVAVDNFRLGDFSAKLHIDSAAYVAERNEILSRYYAGRRQRRDFRWYCVRLRPRYARILLQARLNRRKYLRGVRAYL